MAAEDVWRLAWQADRDGRPGMRDALLTLAVAESGPDVAVAAERCRRKLIAGRPDHWFAPFPTLGQALANDRVARALDRLRATFPEARVRRLLMRGDVRRGPYRAGRPSLSLILDDLLGPLPGASQGPAIPEDDRDGLVNFYLRVLLAIAILLATVVSPSAKDSKAA
jgi:hypothetical protein